MNPTTARPCNASHALKLIARCAIACAAALPALASARASAGSSTSTQSTAACLGADGVPSGTSTSVVSIATLASGAGGCTARASGFAYAGVDKLKLTFNIGATGGVSTSGSFNPQGQQVGLGQADIGYGLLVGNTHAQGTMSVSSDSPVNQQGTWGTITGSVEITRTSGSDDDYEFAAFGLSLTGHANARAIHRADPSMPILFAQTDAEFGTTLIWEGIIDAQAFDRFGNEIPLTGDFEIGLIGRQTGMNYWYAAVRDTVPDPVPEPGSWALVLAGLALLAVRRRRSH